MIIDGHTHLCGQPHTQEPVIWKIVEGESFTAPFTRAERGSPLSADILIGLMSDLFKEGYGDEVEFDRDRIGVTWAQFGHMYRNFYVYQYTTGISGAHALVKPILSGDHDAVERYHGFLKAGGSRYPIDNLKQTGVDLTAPKPVESTFDYLASLVDRLEELFS